VLKLSRRLIANSRHEANLVIDEDERGVFRRKRFVEASWIGHDILLEKRKRVAALAGGMTLGVVALVPFLIVEQPPPRRWYQ